MQINKCSALFKNRLQSIERILVKEKPDIICISETNINNNDFDSINYFDEYKHELNLNTQQIGISRNSIMIRKTLNYIRRTELEDANVSDIVREFKSRGNKPILILGQYREWVKLKISNQPNSKSIKEQINRFKVTETLGNTIS